MIRILYNIEFPNIAHENQQRTYYSTVETIHYPIVLLCNLGFGLKLLLGKCQSCFCKSIWISMKCLL